MFSAGTTVVDPDFDFAARVSRLVLRPNRERSENGKKRPRLPKRLEERRNVRSPKPQ